MCWCSVPPRDTFSACTHGRCRAAAGRARPRRAAAPARTRRRRGRRQGPAADRAPGRTGRGRGPAAAHQQPVDAVKQRRRVVDVAVRGQHHRDRARFLQRLRVGEPQCQPRRREVALAAARPRRPRLRGLLPQLVRHHADQRRGGGAGASAGHRPDRMRAARQRAHGSLLQTRGVDSRTPTGGLPHGGNWSRAAHRAARRHELGVLRRVLPLRQRGGPRPPRRPALGDCMLRSVDFAEIEPLQRAGRWDEAGRAARRRGARRSRPPAPS